MGAVYLARQLSLGRVVAIKVLPPQVAHDGLHSAERFENEARTMARLNHPGIVGVHDFGQTEDEQFYYFAMEFVEGADLAKTIHGSKRLAPDHALAIVGDVCSALCYAHAQGVVHRDIKPANILISSYGQVKVSDFGLAKFINPSQPDQQAITQDNMAMGTPDYAAPEALAPGDSDARADLYSVGVMLYQMLTGEVPRGLFKMPSQKFPDLDSRFDAIICKALEPEREERYQAADDITRDLRDIRTDSTLPRMAVSKSPRRYRHLWIVPAALTTILLVMGSVYVFHTVPVKDAGSSTKDPVVNAETVVRLNDPKSKVNDLAINQGNVASQAIVSTNDDRFGPGFGADKSTDGLVSGGIPGQPSFDDSVHSIFYSFGKTNKGAFSDSTNELVLDFTSAVDLVELATYVTSNIRSGADDADRVVIAVGFWVNTGNGLRFAGTVDPADTDDVGGFDRASLSGKWANATQVVFTFTPINTKLYARTDVRVGEVLALTKVPVN